ncbi:hypothetical protein D1872_324980 [compost metagenome]
MLAKGILHFMNQIQDFFRFGASPILNHIAVNGRDHGVPVLQSLELETVRQPADRFADIIIVFEHGTAGRVVKMMFSRAVFNDSPHLA